MEAPRDRHDLERGRCGRDLAQDEIGPGGQPGLGDGLVEHTRQLGEKLEVLLVAVHQVRKVEVN
jgi:hypothetical protein